MDASTKLIISAAGSRGRRHWNNHLGRPKHFIQMPPGGETLLRRTVRIARELGVKDILIVASESDPPGWSYETEGATVYRKPMPEKERDVHYRQADRYLPRSLWNTEGRTLFVPGDFYFCHDTLKAMLEYDPDTWVFYARIAGTTWPKDSDLAMERTRMILGFGFPAKEHDLVMKSIEEITAMQRDPMNPIRRSLGLDIYRYMAGQTPEEVARTGGESGTGIWKNYPPHLWQPPAGSADVDFDNPETYGGFMLHYQPDLHG
jgi:hypothetical protein